MKGELSYVEIGAVTGAQTSKFFADLFGMKVRAPQLMLAQLAVTLMLLLLMHDRSASPRFWLTALALVTTSVTMGIAIRGNVPLNRQMDHWSPSQPPDGWDRIRDRWLGYHRLRSIAEIAGFVALLVSALLYSSGDDAPPLTLKTAKQSAAADAAARRS